METMPDAKELMLINVIVNRGSGSKVLHVARQNGLPGGTVVLGWGTYQNPLLKMLALNDVHKEIVFLVAERAAAEKFLQALDAELKLHKPNHGIAFMKSLSFVCGSANLSCGYVNVNSEEKTMYQCVYIIVDKGKAEAAIETAYRMGAGGATIMNARGLGTHETSKLFNMEIEPEKEVAIFILKREQTESVVAAIRDELGIDKPGNGIVFIQNVQQVYGLYDN